MNWILKETYCSLIKLKGKQEMFSSLVVKQGVFLLLGYYVIQSIVT